MRMDDSYWQSDAYWLCYKSIVSQSINQLVFIHHHGYKPSRPPPHSDTAEVGLNFQSTRVTLDEFNPFCCEQMWCGWLGVHVV